MWVRWQHLEVASGNVCTIQVRWWWSNTDRWISRITTSSRLSLLRLEYEEGDRHCERQEDVEQLHTRSNEQQGKSTSRGKKDCIQGILRKSHPGKHHRNLSAQSPSAQNQNRQSSDRHTWYCRNSRDRILVLSPGYGSATWWGLVRSNQPRWKPASAIWRCLQTDTVKIR